eukprot:CFRG5400T1
MDLSMAARAMEKDLIRRRKVSQSSNIETALSCISNCDDRVAVTSKGSSATNCLIRSFNRLRVGSRDKPDSHASLTSRRDRNSLKVSKKHGSTLPEQSSFKSLAKVALKRDDNGTTSKANTPSQTAQMAFVRMLQLYTHNNKLSSPTSIPIRDTTSLKLVEGQVLSPTLDTSNSYLQDMESEYDCSHGDDCDCKLDLQDAATGLMRILSESKMDMNKKTLPCYVLS